MSLENKHIKTMTYKLCIVVIIKLYLKLPPDSLPKSRRGVLVVRKNIVYLKMDFVFLNFDNWYKVSLRL